MLYYQYDDNDKNPAKCIFIVAHTKEYRLGAIGVCFLYASTATHRFNGQSWTIVGERS